MVQPVPQNQIEYRGFTLDPFQVEALRCLDEGKSVIVAAPTGAGKTLIAEYAMERCLSANQRVIYTGPIKALSNQKFRDFRARWGERIGIVTGDVTINPGATAVIMTTEIFRNTLFDEPERLSDVACVIFDEIHFLDDEERGTVWEESIIFAPPHIRFVYLSATIPNLHELAAWIRRARRTPLAVIEMNERPIPLRHLLNIQGFGVGNLKDLRRLEHEQGERRFWHEARSRRQHHRERQAPLDAEEAGNDFRTGLVDHLQAEARLPCLYFIFSRKDCEARARENQPRQLLSPEERDRMRELVDGLLERYQVQDDLIAGEVRELALHGIAFHHAGMLPTLKEIVERLFTSGLIKLLFATETFAVGVNMPARSVTFDTVHKFDGVRRSYLKTREYHQMAGRAGRRGMDAEGYVYSNIEWPFVHPAAIEKILGDEIEPIQSQFSLAYATLLNLHQRLGRNITRACEESFANFLAQKTSAPSKKRDRRRRRHRQEPPRAPSYQSMVEGVRRRLAWLRRWGYLDGDVLTPKGMLASTIFGYEIPMVEFLTAGFLRALDPDQVNVLVAAIVFEGKRADRHAEFREKQFAATRFQALRLLRDMRRSERALGVYPMTKDVDFDLSQAISEWSRGCEFRELEACTTAADGDLVRTIRLVLQVERQLLRALQRFERRVEEPLWGIEPPKGGHFSEAAVRAVWCSSWQQKMLETIRQAARELPEKLRDAMARINRDVVDAERQLRLG